MLEWLAALFRVMYDRPMRYRLIGYRPVVMCLIQATDSERFLFIRPTAKPQAWMLPQEGIEPDESVEQAAVRGLKAELGIAENQLHFRRSKWLRREIIPEQKGERDIPYSLFGMRGKAYYGALIKLSAATAVKLNEAEVAGHEWLEFDQIAVRMRTNSERKQKLIRQVFQVLLERTLPISP